MRKLWKLLAANCGEKYIAVLFRGVFTFICVAAVSYTHLDVYKRQGVQIGVFGVLGEDAAACAPESGLEFDDIVETSKRVVKELQKKDVDMIVCLSHSGTNEDEDKSEDEILAEEVPEIRCV